MNDKIENLKFIVNRYDHYYDAINNKGNVYLTLMTFLLGGLITIFFSVNKYNPCDYHAWALLVLTLALQLTGIIMTLLALRPYRKSGTDRLNPSNLYFGDVASLTDSHYKQQMSSLTDDEFEKDITSQIHALARGLRNKYEKLYWSTNIIGIQIILIAIIAFLIN